MSQEIGRTLGQVAPTLGYVPLTDDIAHQLRQEFLADARDSLDAAQTALNTICDGSGDPGRLALEFQRQIHTLKGMGGSFGFPTISLLAHQLEDFVADAGGLTAATARQVEIFLDHIDQILDTGVDDGMANASDLIRALPTTHGTQPCDSAPDDIEVVMITPSKVLARAVKNMLTPRGCRVLICGTPWEALELAVCAQPDVIVSSAVMDHVTGIDLLCAFSQIEATSSIPKIVLTSFERDHPQLQRLPKDVHVVRSGREHRDALAAEIVALATDRSRRAAASVADRALNILVAEDKLANRMLIQTMIGNARHRLTLAENGAEAVRELENAEFDVVLMDIEMPVMDGIAATQAVRALQEPKSKVPIIALTGNDNEDDKAHYLNVGMNDHVAKPIDRRALYAAIERQTGVAVDAAEPGIAQDDTSGDADDPLLSLAASL